MTALRHTLIPISSLVVAMLLSAAWHAEPGAGSTRSGGTVRSRLGRPREKLRVALQLHDQAILVTERNVL